MGGFVGLAAGGEIQLRPDVPDYRVTRWTVEEGLPENFVRALAQSADGHIWIGTSGGLVRYNGTNLKFIDDRPQPEPQASSLDRIRALLPGGNDTLWIASEDNGITFLRQNKFAVLPGQSGLPRAVLSLGEEPAGVLWIGTNDGLFRWQEGRFRRMEPDQGKPPRIINVMRRDTDGRLLFGSASDGLLRWTGQAFEAVVPADAIPADNGVRDMARDREGRLWIALQRGGLLRVESSGAITPPEQIGGLAPPLRVRTLFVDRDGRLFAGTEHGLLIWSHDRFRSVEDRGRPLTDDIHTIMQDVEGSLWLGGIRGALRLVPGGFTIIDSAQGLPNEDLKSVLEAGDGTLWIGTGGGGLSHYHHGSFQTFSLDTTTPEPAVYSLVETADHGLVAGSRRGLFLLEAGRVRPAPAEWQIGQEAVRALAYDRQGTLWIGGDRCGLVAIRDHRPRRPLQDAGLPFASVRALATDATEGLWAGTDGGLVRVKGSAIQVWNRQDGLPSERIRALVVDEDGGVWIGTGAGLAHWQAGRIHSWRGSDGLKDERIFSIVDDGRGGLWILCPSGVYRVWKSELAAQARGERHAVGSALFSTSYGMVGGSYNGGTQPAGLRSRDGRLYFATPVGLATIAPEANVSNTRAPPVIVERVEFRNSRARQRDGVYQIGPGQGLLEIKFTALSFRDPDKNEFRYQLEGVDPDWARTRLRRSAPYANLAPGLYRFQVTAANSDGVWNEEGVTIWVRVIPFYYQTLWFRSLIATAVVCLIGSGVWLRVRTLHRRQQKLEELVAARTRDLQTEIAQRRQTEEELRHSEERLSRTFSASPVPMLLCRFDDGTVIDANAGLAGLVGRPRERLLGRPDTALALWQTVADRESVLAAVRAGQPVRNRDFTINSAAGTRQVLVSAESLTLTTGPHVLFIFHDITDRTALEQQLRRLQKFEAIGTLAAGIAHDFNNLLTVIRGYVSLLLATDTPAIDSRRSLEQIRTASDRATRLTQQLLAYSRQQQLNARPFQINDLLNRLTGLLGPVMGETVQVIQNHAAALPCVNGDEGQIEQVIINMAVNARDAMPRGGELRLATSLAEVDATATARNPEARPGRMVRLTVSDTGNGMDEATLGRIFEPFFTTKEVGRGTGLGLATAFGIIKQHQGWIEVRSKLGQGTVFDVYLPAWSGPAANAPEPASAPSAKAGGECILVVEDERTVLQLVQAVLQRNGYRVLSADSGPAALQIARTEIDRIDLLLTDFVMPEGMSGLDLARELSRLRPGLRVIVSTGYSPDLVGLRRTDGWAVIRKPFEPTELLSTVRSVLNRPPAD